MDESVQDLAEMLQQLKSRTNRSYEALARRSGLSRSSVHRYCSGAAVPADFESLSQLAKACGANRDELLELHRRWALASAAARVTTQARVMSPGPLVSDEPLSPAVADPMPDSPPPASPRRRWLWRRSRLVAAVALVMVGALALAAPQAIRSLDARDDGAEIPRTAASRDARVLFSPACAGVVSMGQQDGCVQELQTLLSRAGTTIVVDSAFGPETLRRVTAFQVLAGLPPRGVVDDATKQALYSGGVSMASWSPERVEKRVREVFTQDPDMAVRIARCQSYLDPHWITPNTNGTRNWGVFQLADVALKRFAGTPESAFDPEWNIAVAHRLWREHQDFRSWPACWQAAQPA